MKPFTSNIKKGSAEGVAGEESYPHSRVRAPSQRGAIRDSSEADLLVAALCEGRDKSVEAVILAHIPLQEARVFELLAD